MKKNMPVAIDSEEEIITDNEDKKDEAIELEPEKEVEVLPAQGSFLGKFVDVYDFKSGKRIGTGKVIREDDDQPYITDVEMYSPPYQVGKTVRNQRIVLCVSQQFGARE